LFLIHSGSSGYLRIQTTGVTRVKTTNGYVDIGPQNANWCHFNTNTDIPKFYFNKTVTANNDFEFYNGGSTKKLSDFVMFGSANAAWVPCPYYMESTGALYFKATNGRVGNEGGTDYSTYWVLPLPTAKGALKLYISGLKLSVSDADTSNYCRVYIYGMTDTGIPLIYTSAEYNTIGLKTETFTAIDVSIYHMVTIKIVSIVATAGYLEYSPPLLQCYYA